MVKVVIDSASDIPPAVAEEFGITVVPYRVHFGSEDYRDRIDLSPAEFYKKLVNGPVFPTTGAPPPGDYAQAFDRLAEETDEILTIVLSSELSASLESALVGREEMKNGKCRVEIVDSLNVTMAEGFLAIIAVEEARAGKNLDQIVDIVRKAMPKAHMRACFDTLEYLRRGGRVGRAKALLGSILKVNPIITITDGVVEPAGRERNRVKAIDNLYNHVKSLKGKIRKLAVEYAEYGNTPEEAEQLAERLASFLPPGEKIYMCNCSPVVGTHTGPAALLVSVLEK